VACGLVADSRLKGLMRGRGAGSRAGCCKAVDVKAGRHVLKSALEAFDVGVELADVILEALNPSLLLSKALTTFLLAVADKLRNFMASPLYSM